MSPKSVAFLVVGMLVISSVFFLFHVSYPANPATIKINPPPNVKPPNLQIFNNQTLNYPKLGLNQTTFSPTGNTTMTLEGYVYNASNPKQALANENLGIAVMQAFTMVTTNSTGFYKVTIRATGQGTFAFKVFQYQERLYTLIISPGISSLSQNVLLTPETKYPVSGLTQSHGNDISGVGLTFQSVWGKYVTSSSSTGAYSLNMVNDLYSIVAIKNGFSPVPDPINVTVNNTALPNFNIQLNSSNQGVLYMNGYVFNQLHNPVSGANVSDIYPQIPNGSAVTNSAGFYNITVAYYSNLIQITAQGYAPFSQSVIITKNTTNQNFTLSSQNPFVVPPGTTGTQSSGPSGLGNSASSAGYGSPTTITISGLVILNQTGMPVPNQQFYLYTSVNGTYFFDTIQTNASGDYTFNLGFPGNYHFAVVSTSFNETWLNISASQSKSNMPIYVSTSSSKVYNISGHLFNGVGNGTLTNATINITTKTGQLLKTIHVNSTGNFSFNILGGNYLLNISSPGFGSTTVPLNVTGNVSNLNLSLSPTTGISPGSSQWPPSSGSGLPGVNGTRIQSQINSTQNGSGQSPVTSSGTPVVISLQMNVNGTSTPVSNTSFIMFIKVNGLYLKVNGATNTTGGALLPLSYGGTYILLPEMIDYTGNALFVNTTSTPQPIIFNMTALPLHNLTVNLSNPYSGYTGSQVPISGLSGDGYALPVALNGSSSGPNYTLAYYSLPNGNYSFIYNDTSYVYSSFNVTVIGANLTYNRTVDPYLLSLSWNTATSWSYTLTGTGIAGSLNSNIGAGSSSELIALELGSFSFSTAFGGNQANTTTFTLSTTASVKSLSFTVIGSSTLINNIPWSYNHTNSVFKANSSLLNSKAIYIDQVSINVNLSTTSVLYLGTTQFTWSGGYTLNLTNYFATKTSGTTTISIVSNGFQDYQSIPLTGVNLTIHYYTANLTG